MQVIEADDVQQSLSFDRLIPALKRAFASNFGMPQRQVYHLSGEGDVTDAFAVLPAWNDEVMGVKAFTHLPGNPSKGLDILASKLMLFSRQTGAPLSLVDGTQLTYWRTAAVSALAADFLANPNAESLLLFGTGKLAPYMALAHATVRPIKTVYIAGRSPEKVQQTIQQILKQRPDLTVLAESEPNKRAGQVDIISCSTSASEPLFNYSDLKLGVHIDLVGNHNHDRRECDSNTVVSSQVYVDSRINVLNEAGELLIPIEEGRITEKHVQGELAELCTGEISGRQTPEEMTLFKSVGTALSDLAAAHLVYQSISDQKDVLGTLYSK